MGERQSTSKERETDLSEQIRVDNLEHLVEAELAQPLQRVADRSWCPTLPQCSNSLLADGGLEASEDALVLLRIHLDAALDQIQRDDSRVRDST